MKKEDGGQSEQDPSVSAVEDHISHNDEHIHQDEWQDIESFVNLPKRKRLDGLNQLAFSDGTRPAT